MRQHLPRRRYVGRIIVAAFAVAALAVTIRLFQHPTYSAGSPAVRLTVAGGCPKSLGDAVDVANPGPSWWDEFWGYSRLARRGATSGLVCTYTGSDVAPVTAGQSASPPVSRALQAQVALTRDQAADVSLAAATQSTLHPRGTFHCPVDVPGAVIIVVLGYPDGADTDIWWNDTGCQNADNGHVQVYFYGSGLSGGDFTGAVEKVSPSAP